MKTTKADLKLRPSQSELENSLQDLFLDFLTKARDSAALTYTSEHDIDSEVSLHLHHMLEEYDKYRNRV